MPRAGGNTVNIGVRTHVLSWFFFMALCMESGTVEVATAPAVCVGSVLSRAMLGVIGNLITTQGCASLLWNGNLHRLCSWKRSFTAVTAIWRGC